MRKRAILAIAIALVVFMVFSAGSNPYSVTSMDMVKPIEIVNNMYAASEAVIWTDKADYTPGEIVTISGSGFNPDSTIDVSIVRPDAAVDTGSTTSNAAGEFVYYYDLDGIEGTYTVTATDGVNTASTTFTDCAIQVKLWGYTLLPSEGWTHGDVKGYYECQWVPYRIEFTSSKAESYEMTVIVHHDYFDGTWNGLDDV